MTPDLVHARDTAVNIARDAADVLLRYFEGPLNHTVKKSPVDIVTEADQEAEKLISIALQTHFPDHHIVGEEGGGMGRAIEEADYRWYVDPLDGTTNFANRIPMFCVSIALTDRAMQPLVGVILNPVHQELFVAVRGQGVTLNDRPIRVSKAAELLQCVLASGFPYDKYTSEENNLKEWGRFLLRTRGLRRMGAAALDLAYVAAGRFDGYWEQKLNPWDCLAGILCVTEAGGIVTDYTGGTPETLASAGKLVASNGHIHQQMLDVLAAK